MVTHLRIKDMPNAERPRERLASAFVEVLRAEHEELMGKLAKIVPEPAPKPARKRSAKGRA